MSTHYRGHDVVDSDHDVMTVLALLAIDEFVVLDPCSDSTPFVVK